MNGPMTTGNATWPNLGSEPPPTVWNQTRDGQLIDGRYRIERLLGVGGMGEVYVAQQLSMGRPVALKLLRTELAKRPQARERFYFEARAASRLNHPNIVTVFDFGSSKEGLFMAMELVNGDTLPSVLADGALDWRRALRLVREVADALAHAHVNDVIHCDVKTENLMLVQRGQRTEHLKILDFGIARLATSTGPVERNSGPAVGTPMAMAPEVILGDPPTPQADIYSLGVVLYEVLSGNQPFEHTTVQKLVQQKLFQAPQDLVLPGASPTTAAAIGDLIRWMMSARPDQRPRSCEVVRERLDGLLAPDATAGGILGLAAPSPAAAPGVSGPLPRIDPTTGKFNLLDALCASPDLPVFATVVQSIEALCQDPSAAADREIERMMTEIGLAQKVLRVANSTFYRGSHPEITRVSRAVMVMGLEQVRRVAMSLPLLGNLEGDADPALLESALRSLASAVMAKELADGQAGVNQEDASTGALMRNLSRHLVQVRFPELAKRVRARAAGLPEDEACREVLGATWEELNLAIAEKMAFPERLRRLLGPIEATDETLTPEEKRLRAVSAFGSELAAVLQAPESPQRNERLHAIVRTHADAITLDPARIKAAMEKTAAVVVEHAAEAGVGLEVAKTIARRVDQMTQPPPRQPSTSRRGGAADRRRRRRGPAPGDDRLSRPAGPADGGGFRSGRLLPAALPDERDQRAPLHRPRRPALARDVPVRRRGRRRSLLRSAGARRGSLRRPGWLPRGVCPPVVRDAHQGPRVRFLAHAHPGAVRGRHVRRAGHPRAARLEPARGRPPCSRRCATRSSTPCAGSRPDGPAESGLVTNPEAS